MNCVVVVPDGTKLAELGFRLKEAAPILSLMPPSREEVGWFDPVLVIK